MDSLTCKYGERCPQRATREGICDGQWARCELARNYFLETIHNIPPEELRKQLDSMPHPKKPETPQDLIISIDEED